MGFKGKKLGGGRRLVVSCGSSGCYLGLLGVASEHAHLKRIGKREKIEPKSGRTARANLWRG